MVLRLQTQCCLAFVLFVGASGISSHQAIDTGPVAVAEDVSAEQLETKLNQAKAEVPRHRKVTHSPSRSPGGGRSWACKIGSDERRRDNCSCKTSQGSLAYPPPSPDSLLGFKVEADEAESDAAKAKEVPSQPFIYR